MSYRKWGFRREIIHVGMAEYIPHTVKVPKRGSNGWFNKSNEAVRNAKNQHDIKVRHRVMSQRNGSRVPYTMREVTFRHKTVRRVLLSFDIDKASDPDLIPAIVLKRCAAELAPISYESGTFPENCKLTHIDPYNYRPIALLSVISKVMKRCINRELLDYLERHSLISDRQSIHILHNVNADVPQGSVLAPTLFLLHINDLLSCTINSIHSFADDSNLCAGIQTEKRRLVTTSSLTRDLEAITAWGRNNLIIEDLIWREHISSIAAAAGKRLGYMFRAKKYFSPHDLLTLYKAQIMPSLEYCSNVWGSAAPTTLSMLDAVQMRAVRLIDDSSLTDSLGTLSHRRAVRIGRYDRFFDAFPSSTNFTQFKNRINKISLGSS
ncbi:unnamed protein product [Acanthoscelides obtectus]|uniref:Reverse transcriptase domain-containing protein n=1 Tax=Acanthoscelides obtectus TaxID=200917 RepID=A0A9P0PP93_ACAOB|nr:unnamed protein product [Acanthoscelides obtectus]CAK1648298.1 hypothetical protein AOBTE_LOCUS15660 [Acanthoscelides obtectus]